MAKNLVALIIFGLVFGLLEAVVVLYLRKIMAIDFGYPVQDYQLLINLGLIAFVNSQMAILGQLTRVEILREMATILMLILVAYLAGSKFKQRLGAFLIVFATWDLSYYLFLKFLTNWPQSLRDIDIYFLIPVGWIGPIITPLIASSLLLLLGLKLYLSVSKNS